MDHSQNRPIDELREVFLGALELDGAERELYLDRACADRPELRVEVAELLMHHDAAPPALADDVRDLAMPKRIGHYEILELLGTGGTGVVYRARQERPRREVAVKVLNPGGAARGDTLRRFVREAEVLGLLEHQGIARIYEAGNCDFGYGDLPFVAMELVDGAPLTEFAEAEGLELGERLALLAEVCDAVQHAHDRGVIHRDLKPANVLVARAGSDGSRARPKVLDFGIARVTAAELDVATVRTSTGQMLGTLPYMSPEQVTGAGQRLDARVDVYGLGVMLFQLLAGRLPFEFVGRSLTEIGRIVRDVDAPALGKIDRRYRGDVETVVAKALAKDRDARYHTAADLADDLRRILAAEPVRARPASSLYQLKRFAQRNRPLVGGVLATLVALSLGLVGTVSYAAEAEQIAGREQALARDYRASLYRAEMRLAADVLDAGTGRERVLPILDRWVPRAGEDDLRGFEWHLLSSACWQAPPLAIPGLHQPKPLSWHRWLECVGRSLDEQGEFVKGFTRVAIDPFAGTVPLRRAEVGIHAHWSADGRLVLATEMRSQRVVHIADAESGEVLAALETRDIVGHGAWDPRGSRIAVHSRRPGSDYDFDVLVIDLVERDGRLALEERILLAARNSDPRRVVEFSADGRFLAFAVTTETERGIAVHETGAFERVHFFEGYGGGMSLRWHPGAAVFAFGARDGRISLFDMDRREMVREFRADAQAIETLEWRADGRKVAFGTMSGALRVLDPESGTVTPVGVDTEPMHALAWSPDGRHLASYGGHLRLWDTDRPSAVRMLLPPRGENLPGGSLAWMPDGERLVVGSDRVCRIVDAVDGDIEARFDGYVPRLRDDGRFLAVRQGRDVAIVDVVTGAEVTRRDLGDPGSHAMCWQPGGTLLAIVGRGTLALWDPVAGAEPHQVEIGNINVMAWDPRGDALHFVGWSNEEWRIGLGLDDARRLRVLPRPTAIAWHAPTDRRAFAHQHKTLEFGVGVEPEEWVTLLGHAGRASCVDWSPDGTRIASGGRDRKVRIFDPDSREEVLAMAHDEDVVAVAWSPDGQQLASLSQDGELRVWDARPR